MAVKSCLDNNIMLPARELSVTWSDDSRYWEWLPLKDARGEEFEAANLFNVCWLEANGSLPESLLTPKRTYEVTFVVMIKDPSHGWEHPVNLRLEAPDGKVQEYKESLLYKPRGRWFELYAGEFRTTVKPEGVVKFALFGSEGEQWKKGLVIRGAYIRTKEY